MKMNPIVHFEMPAKNTERMIKFYTRTFGWETRETGPDMGGYVVVMTTEMGENYFPKEPGRINGGFFTKTTDRQHPNAVIGVVDIKEAMKKITAEGGKLLPGQKPGEPDYIPGTGFYASFVDTEGNRMAIIQPDPMMDSSSEKFEITRIFDAPVERVWKTWTEPEEVKKWWGPKDFTAPHIDIDFRKGGKYLYAMSGTPAPGMPQGDFWSTGTFDEIIPLKKITVTDSFSDEKGNIVPAESYGLGSGFPIKTAINILFESLGSRTKLTLKYPDMSGLSAADRSNMEQGWNQSLDKFAEALK